MRERHHTFCRICECLCGLVVETEAGRVLSIRPDRDHVATEGHCCPKGLWQHEIYGSPDRLARPLRREGRRFREVGWPEALSEIGGRIRRIRRERGPDAIAMYVGTAAGFGLLHPVFAQGFMTGLGSRSTYSSASQDCSNKLAVAEALYGFPFLQPFPDVDRVECLIVVGSNPVVSEWSFLQLPRPVRHLRAIVERGGRLVFVDPRRTESVAATGGEHLPIRPGTDRFFYLSFVHELLRQGGVDRGRVARFAKGLGAVERLVEPWPPGRTAAATGIPAEALSGLVASYRGARGAALYCSTGVNMGPAGSLCFWLQEVANAASGNLDRRGGTTVGRGLFDFPGLARRGGVLMRKDRSRVGSLPSVNDSFPGGLFADEVLTPGPGQVRALVCTGGNPLVTMPGAGRLRRALERLELLVTIDVLRNETGELAHFVLPSTSPLERPDLPFAFPFFLGIQRRPYLQATRAVLRPGPDQWEEPRIFAELAAAARAPLFGSWPVTLALLAAFRAGLGTEPLLSLALRAVGQGSFAGLAAERHGRLLRDHRPGDFLGSRVLTRDGLVDLAPRPLLEEARGLEAAFEAELREASGLRLIGKRTVRTHNSWTHDVERFARAEGWENALWMHPDDAARAGLGEGDLADVATETATVRVPVRLTRDLALGAVALPHGWGHQAAPGLTVASRTRGVNSNLLAPDGPASLEPLSGMARLTAIPVEVRPAAGPRDVSSWSGLRPDEPPRPGS